MAKTATVFLRGVDERAVRLAKVEAARSGLTLGRVVGDALIVSLGGGSVDPSADALAADEAWLESARPRLLRKYADQYVAVLDARVADHDLTFDALARRVFAKHGTRNVLIAKLTSEPRVVRVRSPRRATRQG